MDAADKNSLENIAAKPKVSKRSRREQQKKSWWFRYRFFLSGLLMLLPLIYGPQYLEQLAAFRGTNGLGDNIVGSRVVGPWEVTLAEQQSKRAPDLNGAAGYMKNFNIALCQGCGDEIRAVYLRIGKPRSMRTAGALGFGGNYRKEIQLPVAENTHLNADLWLTLEGWDGRVHRAKWSLAEASPITIEWLKEKQNK